MELAVVDASVAAKWILAEADSATAKVYLGGSFQLWAPSLIRIEVGGAAIRSFRRGTLTEPLTRLTLERWHLLLAQQAVHLMPAEDLWDTAVDLSLKCKQALPDCFYIAGAAKLGARLITADRTMYERALVVHDRVELLVKAA